MFYIVRALTAICCVALFHGVAADVGAAIASGKIAEVNVSPDLRRVTVRTEGFMGNHKESTAANPSRLILDIPGMTLAKPPALTGAGKYGGLGIRTAQSESGARVVLDFGNAPIPEHRIRRLGNYLMVFLQEWNSATGPPHRAGWETAPAAKESASLPQEGIRRDNPWSNPGAKGAQQEAQPKPLPRSQREERPHRLRPVTEIIRSHNGSPELFIRSAEVSDGLIVLHVGARDNPAMIYRIDLGVDFSQLGFSAARISPVGSEPTRPIRVAARKSPFWDESPQPRIGPRKYQPACATVGGTKINSDRPMRVSSR
jgi:hypothetical protein